MVRPTDPAKLAALRLRQAANSRAYRARKAAERAATTSKPAAPRPNRAPSSERAVERAHEARAAAKARRNEIVGQLPSARNPQVTIYTPRPVPTAPAGIPKTAAERRQRIKVIRENARNQQLVNIGRERKESIRNTLRYDPRADSLKENLGKIPGGRARFEAAVNKLASVSQQTLGIFLTYEGGEGDFQSALTQLAYPTEQDPEDALGRIEALAETAQRGEKLYGPAAVGRLRI